MTQISNVCTCAEENILSQIANLTHYLRLCLNGDERQMRLLWIILNSLEWIHIIPRTHVSPTLWSYDTAIGARDKSSESELPDETPKTTTNDRHKANQINLLIKTDLWYFKNKDKCRVPLSRDINLRGFLGEPLPRRTHNKQSPFSLGIHRLN